MRGDWVDIQSESKSESVGAYVTVRDSTRLLPLSASRKKEVSERYKADLKPSLKVVRLGVAFSDSGNLFQSFMVRG